MTTSTAPSVRVAVIQDAPVRFELEPTLEKVADLAVAQGRTVHSSQYSPRPSSVGIPRDWISGLS